MADSDKLLDWAKTLGAKPDTDTPRNFRIEVDGKTVWRGKESLRVAFNRTLDTKGGKLSVLLWDDDRNIEEGGWLSAMAMRPLKTQG